MAKGNPVRVAILGLAVVLLVGLYAAARRLGQSFPSFLSDVLKGMLPGGDPGSGLGARFGRTLTYAVAATAGAAGLAAFLSRRFLGAGARALLVRLGAAALGGPVGLLVTLTTVVGFWRLGGWDLFAGVTGLPRTGTAGLAGRCDNPANWQAGPVGPTGRRGYTCVGDVQPWTGG